MCRESQMGVAAAQRALADAGLAAGEFDPERIGVVFGSDYMLTLPDDFTAGILPLLGRRTATSTSRRWAADGMPQAHAAVAAQVSAEHAGQPRGDLQRPARPEQLDHAARGLGRTLAVGEAFRTIVRGSADMMVAGATGTRVHPMKMVHSVTQEEVAGNGVDPARASRPFDLNRSGMVLGEGAGAIVLEELESRPRARREDLRPKSSARPRARWPIARRGPSRDGAGQRDDGRAARRAMQDPTTSATCTPTG